jgi:hypothetical protein
LPKQDFFHQVHFFESDELEGVNDNFRDFPFDFPGFFADDDSTLKPPAAALAKIASAEFSVSSVKSDIKLLIFRHYSMWHKALPEQDDL